jgi:RNA polymerase sigma-70 factor (ECF subfamily)
MSRSRLFTRLAELFGAEYDRLVGYARRSLDDIADWDGEDIVQEVALNLFDRADVLAPIEDLSAYVFQSIRNKIVDVARKKRPAAPPFAEEMDGGDVGLGDALRTLSVGTGDEVERRELVERVYEIMDRELNIDERAVIIATELEGLSFRELAERLDVPIGTLLARKSRGIHKLRRAITEIY